MSVSSIMSMPSIKSIVRRRQAATTCLAGAILPKTYLYKPGLMFSFWIL